MGFRFDRQCITCKRWEVEEIEDWISVQCVDCNTRDIERAQERREWNYYHSGEPMTATEDAHTKASRDPSVWESMIKGK